MVIASKASAKEKGPLISRITIRGTNIFDFETKNYLRKFPYTAINALHIQTKQEVIERELLFKVGDPADDFLIEETERNLRALSFIEAARIAKFPQRDGTVVIVVYVSDAWTTEPQFNVGGQNKVNSFETGIREKNFLGYGKNLAFLYKKSPDSIQKTYKYTDPRLLGSRWQLSGQAVNETDGRERRLGLDRPFYSADTRWAATNSYERTEAVVGQFVNNVRISESKQTKETSQVGGSVKVGQSRTLVQHVGLRYRMDSTNFAATDKTNTTLPPSQKLKTIFFDLETIRVKFIKIDRIEKMTRVEDYNLGPTLTLAPGFSPHKLTGKSESTDELGGTYEQRWLSHDTNLSYLKYSYGGRNVFKNSTNTRNAFYYKYYYRELPIQTVVFNTRAEWGNELDPDNQIILGSDNGMRAYKIDQFVGNRSWVLNIEDRFFFVDDFLNLVSIGAAAFYDVGNAWSQGQSLSVSDLHNSVGAGLRFGLTKSSNEVIIRFDISYRMETVNTDNNRWVFTFGTGQAF